MIAFWGLTGLISLSAIALLYLPTRQQQLSLSLPSVLGCAILCTSYSLYTLLGTPMADLERLYRPSYQKRAQEYRELRPYFVRLKKQQAHIKIALLAQQDNPELWWQLGQILVIQQDYPAAQEAYRYAYQYAEDNPHVLAEYLKTSLKVHQGKLPLELRKLAENLAHDNAYQGLAYQVLAIDDYRQGRYQQAADYWQRLQQTVPLSPEMTKAVTLLRDKATQMDSKPVTAGSARQPISDAAEDSVKKALK